MTLPWYIHNLSKHQQKLEAIRKQKKKEANRKYREKKRQEKLLEFSKKNPWVLAFGTHSNKLIPDGNNLRQEKANNINL